MARVTISSNNLFPGPRGAQGPAGPEGGPAGPTGPQGPQGIQGPAGAQGIQGPAGPTGAGGAQGLKGDTGNKGDTGDTGPAGTNGTNGTNGAGVVVGGTVGQALTKINSTDYNTQWTTIPLLSTANTFTGGVQQITTASAATKGLIVKGTASQSANLQEWQDNAGTVLSFVDLNGQLRAQQLGINGTGTGVGYVRFSNPASDVGTRTVVVRAVASQTGNLTDWQNSAGTSLAKITSGGSFTAVEGLVIGSASFAGVGYNGISNPTGVTTLPSLIVKGIASQTGNLQEWQNSAGNSLASITSAGVFTLFANDAGAHRTIITTSSSGVVFNSTRGSGTASNFIIQTDGSERFSVSAGGTAQFTNTAAAAVAVVIQGAASQTADLQQWRSSTSALTTITSAGTINFASGNTSATANTGAVTAPALVVGFITMQVAGTTVKVPYYTN